MSPIAIIQKGREDQAWVEATLTERWGATLIVSRGATHDAASAPALIAIRDGMRCGLATWSVDGDVLELLTLDALQRGAGVGTLLLAAIEMECLKAGCTQSVLSTTNDNLDALAFYQKRGWRLSRLDAGAIDRARSIKPSIPLIGENGIPIRDELELTRALAGALESGSR